MFFARFGPILTEFVETILTDFYNVLFSVTKWSGNGVEFRFLLITEF